MPLKLPTPPTPPTIDKGEVSDSTPRIDVRQFLDLPIKRETQEKPAEKSVEKPPPAVEKKVTTPEDMAREAVANGSGALTKRTVTRPDAEIKTTPNLPVTNNPNRGKEILREFQNEDRQTFQTTETPRNFKRSQNESYGGFYWIVIIVLAGILSFFIVRKFLVKKNPQLKKSDLFSGSDEKLKAVSEKVAAPIKKSPPKKDDDKGKHFEVRV